MQEETGSVVDTEIDTEVSATEDAVVQNEKKSEEEVKFNVNSKEQLTFQQEEDMDSYTTSLQR